MQIKNRDNRCMCWFADSFPRLLTSIPGCHAPPRGLQSAVLYTRCGVQACGGARLRPAGYAAARHRLGIPGILGILVFYRCAAIQSKPISQILSNLLKISQLPRSTLRLAESGSDPPSLTSCSRPAAAERPLWL